jgi:hypothetical protein
MQRMTAPIIIVVTGASGSGKTATVRAVEARGLAGVRCHNFDTVGVPSIEDMYRDFGSPEQWQAITTRRWLDRLSTDPSDADVHILDGQTRPSFVREAAARARITQPQIVLLDCEASVRHMRLAKLRGQPELANSQIDCWAAYLRGQADALNLPVIDTTALGIDGAADALVVFVEMVRAAPQAAAEQAHQADVLRRAAHAQR